VNPRRTILVVEDDSEMRSWLEEELRETGYDVCVAEDGHVALRQLESSRIDAVITDVVMPGLRGGELLAEVRSRDPAIPVVVISAFGTIESAVETMRAGAFHYVPKPFRFDQLRAAIESALQQRAFLFETASAPGLSRAEEMGLVAESPAMRRALELTLRATHSDAPVLLLGESGTGKEMLARVLHASGPRSEAPFVAVNCAAIPENLLESQLFGHRRGAFTDAREDHAGMFQIANHGTLLLDEIGDMPLMLQVKLLRVLQEREVHPLGAAAPVPVDVRVIAATHADLDQAVRESRFRQDLFYRLNVIQVRIPPLRDRPEDVLPLIQHFLEKSGRRSGARPVALEPTALDALRRHSWPGNIRELENAIERALVLGRGDTITVGDLPPSVVGRSAPERAIQAASLAGIEREHILRTLRAVGGNRAAAARVLAVDRKTLYRKLKLYGLV
jgi:DNA-binding NtrC family response regulator